jgi:type I restriction enzyme R subunit
LGRQVLENVDAFLIGLTATPLKQTIGFLNRVTKYNHERAVADGMNVGYDVYRIKIDVMERGGKVEKDLWMDRCSKRTRKKRWDQPNEDFEYTAKEGSHAEVIVRDVLG